MTRNRFCPRQQTGNECKQLRRHKVKTAQAESQEDKPFPADEHPAITPRMTLSITRHERKAKRTTLS